MGYFADNDRDDMSITQITTHNTDALARLLYQYKDSANIKSFLTAIFGTQVQELEDAIYSIFSALDIQNVEGDQLDQVGTIVGQERYGVDDVEYRIRLLARIGKNVSEGDIERVISVWRLFSPMSVETHLVEHFPAEVAIYSDSFGFDVALQTEGEEDLLTEGSIVIAASYQPYGVDIELQTENGESILTEGGDAIVAYFLSQAPDIISFMQDVVAAGVKFGYACIYDSVNAFGFEGSVNAAGFGDYNDADVGGELSYIVT